MRTIGQLLKQARLKKKISLVGLAKKTKIKKEFISAIERQDWKNLPSFGIVLGFVKSIAASLGVSEKQAVAVLRRDYTLAKGTNVNPKPDVEAKKFAWSPKLTFAIGVGIVLVAILGYLTLQYVRFISPPQLNLDNPTNGQIVKGNTILVSGTTNPDAKVVVNNQPVIVDDNGNFSVALDVVAQTGEIVVKAVSRSGKETTIHRKIQVE